MDDIAKVTEVTLGSGEVLTVDEGMRRWYEGCACCLRDTYPEVKEALDAERKALRQAAKQAEGTDPTA